MRHELKYSKYGYLSLCEMPSKEELEDYYKKRYFQMAEGSYEHIYSKGEKRYFQNRAKVAKHITERYLIEGNKLLDVGTGEGFFAQYFYDCSWSVKTIDYSDFGLKSQNPKLASTLEQGDIFKLIDKELSSDKKYSLINISNVLEHVIDPIMLLEKLKKLLEKDGILRISVPNDYSSFQKYLIEQNYTTDTWFCPPDHLHYFTFDTLSNLLIDLDYRIDIMMSEFPIELFLVNKASNYVKDKNVGKNAHLARIEIDNFLFDEDIEKYINYYQASASINFGRQIVMYVRNNNTKG